MFNPFSIYAADVKVGNKPDEVPPILKGLFSFISKAKSRYDENERLLAESMEKMLAENLENTPNPPAWIDKLQSFTQKIPGALENQYQKGISTLPKPLQFLGEPGRVTGKVISNIPNILTTAVFKTPEERAQVKQVKETGTLAEKAKLQSELDKRAAASMAFAVSSSPIESGLTPQIARGIFKVKPNATEAEINTAYKALISKEAPRTVEQLAVASRSNAAKIINNARELLLNEAKGLVKAGKKLLPGVEAKVTPERDIEGVLDQAKTMADDVANTKLDEVRGLVYSGDNAAAQKLFNKIDNPNKPDFKALIDEVLLYQQKIEAEGMKAVGDKFGEYQKDYNRIKAKVKSFGETTAKKTKELYREHVPAATTGQMSSDELANLLGVSENELMARVADDIAKEGGVIGGKTATRDLTISKGKQIRQIVSTFPVSRGKIPVAPGQEYIPEVVGQTYNAEPTEATLGKIGQRQTLAREKTAKQDFDEWQKQVVAQEGVLPKTPGQEAEMLGGMVKESTLSPLSTNIEELKDLPWLGKKTLDTTRVFETVYGKRFPEVDRTILQPFDNAKEQMLQTTNKLLNELKEKVVDPLGGRKSKESADIQKFGEGIKTKEELVTIWGKEKADKIVDADAWFRQKYDELLDTVNKGLESIYPDKLDKRIPKRTDYYRHFAELSGFGGLKKALQNPEVGNAPNITPPGVIKPSAKWMSIAKERFGGKTEYDAVGGFLDYIPQASYMIHINPQIQVFRNLAKELANQTNDVNNAATYGKLNRFISWLNNEAGHLAGEPNPYDTWITKGYIDDPRVFRALDWTNRNVKANVMLGNLGASLVQSANMVQGVAKAGIKNFVAGTVDVLFSPLKGEFGPATNSKFLKERYSYKKFREFDVGFLEKSRDFAAWITTVLDEFGTRTNWNAIYRKGIEDKVADPMRYADLETGKLVGHRGIGAQSEVQRAMTTQLIAPFQLEVTNNWHVMGDMVSEKTYGALIKFLIYSWIFNSLIEKVTGRRPLFDPVDAMYDATTDPSMTPLERVGRVAGEVLSNVPFGQTLASTAIQSPESRKKFFGEEDPTRYGGGIIATKALSDPLFTVLNPLGFGGTQIKRTYDSLMAISRGYSKTASGDMRYPVSTDVDNVFQILAMGQYSTPTAQFYFKENLRPLSDNQIKQWKNSVAKGKSPEVAWAEIYKRRITDGLSEKYGAINKEKISAQEKAKKRAEVKKEYNDLKSKLETFATGKSGFTLIDLLNLVNKKGAGEEPNQFESYAPQVNQITQTNPFSQYAAQ